MSNRLKLKVRSKIPAALLGGIGTTVTKDGLTYRIDLDYSQLQDNGNVFDPNYVVVAIWNPHTGEWARVSLTNFINGSLSPAAFDIIAPTTTRGDLIFRNATTNTRLPASTAGYFLQSGGPGADPSYIGFFPIGTGAVSRTWMDKGRDTVSVMDFGAVGDGVTDDTTAIRNAIAALPATGGTVFFPPKTFLISGPITIGNGTSSAVSTRHGVALVGLGSPNSHAAISGYPTPSVPRLLMSNSVTGTPLISIAGPVQGWGVRNLFLDGSNDTNTGILVNSGQFGDVKNVAIDNVFTGISSTSYALGGYTGVGNVDSLNNIWTNVNIRIAGAVGAKGVFLNGDSGGTSNTDFNTFTNVSVNGKSNNTNFAFYLAVADSNVFINCGVAGVTTGLAFDYSFNNSFPNSNRFFGYDFAVYQNIGTPGAGALAAPHYFYGLSRANNHGVPGLLNTYTDVSLDGSGNLSLTATTGALGYGTGAGGAVTQTTSKSTAVTLNRPTGLITTMPDAMGAGASVQFVFNNSVISNTDLILVQHASSGTLGAYTVTASTGTTGATTVFIRNNTGGTLTENLIIRFAVVRSANS